MSTLTGEETSAPLSDAMLEALLLVGYGYRRNRHPLAGSFGEPVLVRDHSLLPSNPMNDDARFDDPEFTECPL